MFGAPYLKKKKACDIGNKLNKSNKHFKFPSLYINGFRMINSTCISGANVLKRIKFDFINSSY